jgi:hypothetical protein
MLAAVSETIAAEGLTIESVSTELMRRTHRKQSDTDFCVEADCVATTYLDDESVHKLVHKLEVLKKDLDLSTLDIRVQRLGQNLQSSNTRRFTRPM